MTRDRQPYSSSLVFLIYNIMRQKFIEGTNKQYSIREDGIIITHYENHNGKIILKNRETKGSKTRGNYRFSYYNNGIRHFTISIKKLLIEYFDIYPLGAKSKLVLRTRKKSSFKQETIYSYPDNCLTRQQKRNYRRKIKDKEHRKTISKRYVAASLKITQEELTDDLYELYKTQLKIKRLIKQKQ